MWGKNNQLKRWSFTDISGSCIRIFGRWQHINTITKLMNIQFFNHTISFMFLDCIKCFSSHVSFKCIIIFLCFCHCLSYVPVTNYQSLKRRDFRQLANLFYNLPMTVRFSNLLIKFKFDAMSLSACTHALNAYEWLFLVNKELNEISNLTFFFKFVFIQIGNYSPHSVSP